MSRPADLSERDRAELAAAAGVPLDYEDGPEGLRAWPRYPVDLVARRGEFVARLEEARVPVYLSTATEGPE